MASVAPAAREAQFAPAACHDSPVTTDRKQKEAAPVVHPAGHRQSADPAALYLPERHGVGVVAPAGQKEPAGQLVQEVAPLLLKVPAGQTVGAALPPVQNEPAGHDEKLFHMIASQKEPEGAVQVEHKLTVKLGVDVEGT